MNGAIFKFFYSKIFVEIEFTNFITKIHIKSKIQKVNFTQLHSNLLIFVVNKHATQKKQSTNNANTYKTNITFPSPLSFPFLAEAFRFNGYQQKIHVCL